MLNGISEDKLEAIENRRIAATLDGFFDLLKNGDLTLCNPYCSNHCGMGGAHEVQVGGLSSIVLSIIVTLNNVRMMHDRLITVVANGVIDENDHSDFETIRNQVEDLSLATEALRLWAEKALNAELI